MKIYSSSLREECEVFGVAVSFSDSWPTEKRVVFYVEDKGARGLCVEELGGAKILDGSLSVNFKIHFFANMDGLIFLWDYFDDLNHLSKLMDFDPETVADFEKARASFSV